MFFSNGPIIGQNSNLVKGDVISAGPSGSVDGVHATSSVYAHSISNSDIDKDAYYTTISGTTVDGTKYPGSPDQATSSLPITDAMIENWENSAAVSVINSPCPYEINSNVTIGPVKINCNLKIKGSPTVTIAGPAWVVGNIEIENSPIIKLASSLGANSVAIIADNPSNRTTGSKIELENSAQFQNSGTDGSYILFISQNNSAQNGGSEKAIRAENSISGEVLVYAGHGEVHLKNNVSLREVSAYKIRLSNYAQVVLRNRPGQLAFHFRPVRRVFHRKLERTGIVFCFLDLGRIELPFMHCKCIVLPLNYRPFTDLILALFRLVFQTRRYSLIFSAMVL